MAIKDTAASATGAGWKHAVSVQGQVRTSLPEPYSQQIPRLVTSSTQTEYLRLTAEETDTSIEGTPIHFIVSFTLHRPPHPPQNVVHGLQIEFLSMKLSASPTSEMGEFLMPWLEDDLQELLIA